MTFIFLTSFSERCGWVPNGLEVPRSLAMEYRWINGLSVTEMEIMHGAYRTENPNCEYNETSKMVACNLCTKIKLRVFWSILYGQDSPLLDWIP